MDANLIHRVRALINDLEGLSPEDLAYINETAATDEMRRFLAGRAGASPNTLQSVMLQARSNHDNYSATGAIGSDISFMALGAAGEAGEALEALAVAFNTARVAGALANIAKKRWRDGDRSVQLEVCDLFAYTVMLADRIGMTAQELIDGTAEKQQAFVAKMQAKPEFTRVAGRVVGNPTTVI